jgi:hypothetical protein
MHATYRSLGERECRLSAATSRPTAFAWLGPVRVLSARQLDAGTPDDGSWSGWFANPSSWPHDEFIFSTR